jgi:hypothetical protein
VKSTVLILIALFGLTLAGCVSQSVRDADPLVTAKQMQAMGLHGRVVIVFGGSHAGGLSWNITGSSGFAEVTLDPNVADTKEPAK